MPIQRFIKAILSVLLILETQAVVADDGFRSLFDGKTLDGWVQRGGKAKYSVDDGMIVGRTVPNTPNSFLCTERRFSNFILEYEYKCDDQLNSGVQFRSNVFDKPMMVEINGKKRTIAAGRVHGYQVEIDPNKPDRMWSGGVYDEGRRGWLFPGIAGGDAKAFTKQGQQVYKKGEWNKARVQCRGPHIQTWLNGVPRADFKDDLTLEGIIALQVHGVRGRKDPLTVRWRNLRIKVLD